MHEASAPRRALLFALGGRNYAIRVAAVGGVADSGPIREVPGAPSSVVGLTEWRGNVLTVLDLPHLLGHPPGDAQPCLVRLAPPLHQAALLLTVYVSVAEIVGDFAAFDAEGPAGESHDFMARFEYEGSVVRLIDPVRLFRHVGSQVRGRP
jgi:hypothetical protein